ncbi:WD40/YVTN/BNR-like repeat-containing protein [Actinomadura yumaensis]|uniref:WD40/YVTN/BNR-like repeat-containing protein n=1 Tax=Actinomadura yumaensis TaxID=111807 RepID=UPI00361A8038
MTSPSVDVFKVLRSQDGGATWKQVVRAQETPYDLLVHPADPKRIAVPFKTLRDSGLLASDDGGATWRRLLHGHVFTTAAGDPKDPGGSGSATATASTARTTAARRSPRCRTARSPRCSPTRPRPAG